MVQVASLTKRETKTLPITKKVIIKYPEYVKYVDPFLINTNQVPFVVMQCSAVQLARSLALVPIPNDTGIIQDN